MCRKCYVTTPIYYASGTPQLGNSYSTVACDVFARFNRLMNRDTFYLTGMDEHGQKIEEVSKKAGQDPKSYVDKVAEGTKKIWKELNINYDFFIRTTDGFHEQAVQAIFERLLSQGDIYLGSYTGHYCVSCETFFTKTQLAEGETCPDCGKPTKVVAEESYFLNLKKYASRLLDFIKANPNFIVPETRKNEVISFIESGLEDLCVSRTTFKWAIPVKSNPKHVIYVWIDALANYITALGYNSNDDANFKKYWLENKNIYHVIGKDILRFHAIYWPIMLMALDIPVNYQLVVHGWILNRDGKMSKSRGNAVYPEDLYSRYGSDPVRYYLAKEMPLGNDGLFSYDRFIERYNNDLANDLGNLVSRSVAMVEKYCGGIVPCAYLQTDYDEELETTARNAIINTKAAMDEFQLQNGINATWELISRANKYIDETMPWQLAKDETKKGYLDSVMYHLIESLRVVANLIAPYLVETAPKVLEAIGLVGDVIDLEHLEYGKVYDNVVVKKLSPLFVRLDPKVELKYYEELQTSRAPKKEPEKELISIDEFGKVELKVGEIINSKRHENAEKLLVSQIKIGDEVRQIVSGIAAYYDPKDIIGKKVIVVTNLKPAKIRGVESNGMILCATNSDKLELIEVNEALSGSIVR